MSSMQTRYEGLVRPGYYPCLTGERKRNLTEEKKLYITAGRSPASNRAALIAGLLINIYT